jgi:hypothetical protein
MVKKAYTKEIDQKSHTKKTPNFPTMNPARQPVIPQPTVKPEQEIS